MTRRLSVFHGQDDVRAKHSMSVKLPNSKKKPNPENNVANSNNYGYFWGAIEEYKYFSSAENEAKETGPVTDLSTHSKKYILICVLGFGRFVKTSEYPAPL